MNVFKNFVCFLSEGGTLRFLETELEHWQQMNEALDITLDGSPWKELREPGDAPAKRLSYCFLRASTMAFERGKTGYSAILASREVTTHSGRCVWAALFLTTRPKLPADLEWAVAIKSDRPEEKPLHRTFYRWSDAVCYQDALVAVLGGPLSTTDRGLNIPTDKEIEEFQANPANLIEGWNPIT